MIDLAGEHEPTELDRAAGQFLKAVAKYKSGHMTNAAEYSRLDSYLLHFETLIFDMKAGLPVVCRGKSK